MRLVAVDVPITPLAHMPKTRFVLVYGNSDILNTKRAALQLGTLLVKPHVYDNQRRLLVDRMHKAKQQNKVES